MAGQHYEAISSNEAGWRWSEMLSLCIDLKDETLRYFHSSGEQVPTPEEAAETAQARAEPLVEQLKALGVQPEESELDNAQLSC